MPEGRSSPTTAHYLAAGLGLCCLALWLRLTALSALPVFVDEGIHLDWAHAFAARQPDYPWLMHGKLLLGVGLAQLQIVGPGALWLGRAAVALLALPACAACIAAGTLAGSRRVGLLAGLVYALWPYAVFHERQVLADPVAAACGALALVGVLRFAHAGRLHRWWPIPVWLATAGLFKLTGLIILAPLGLAPLFLTPAGTRRWRLALWLALAAAAAAGLGGLVLAGLRPWLGSGTADLAGQQVGFLACPPVVCQADLAQQLQVTRQALAGGLQAALVYLGGPGLLLAGAAPWLARRSGLPRWAPAVHWAWWATAAMLAVLIGGARAALPPRYFAPAAVLVAVLAAVGWASLARSLARFGPAGRWLKLGLAAVVLWPFAQLPVLIARPWQARLPDVDREQYVDGPYAGTGLHEAALAILRRETGAGPPARVLVDHYLLTTVPAYFDRTRVDPATPLDATWPEVAGTLAAGGRVYLIDQVAANEAQALPGGELVGAYPRLGGEYVARLQAFAGGQPATLAALFGVLFERLDSFRADYAALADYLGQQAPPLPLVAYPPGQAAYLRPMLAPPQAEAILEASGPARPWSIAETLAGLEQAAARHDRLAVSFFLETRLDPGREIETWLAQHLFRVNERWFGPVRLVEYAGPRADFEVLPVQARFGEAIVLEAVDVFDPAVVPGGHLRLRLRWLAEGHSDHYYKVFVHLFNAAGIAAQHDGQPMAELRPTPTWQPGEIILDQVALAIPPALAPGQYQLRIGLYDAASLARLPALLADGGRAEFFVGGRIDVR